MNDTNQYRLCSDLDILSLPVCNGFDCSENKGNFLYFFLFKNIHGLKGFVKVKYL